jgi:uncharacterized protein (TIGR03435 family)
MKVTFLVLTALSAVCSIHAQDLVGTWQGVVHPPDTKDDLRTVIKVITSENGAFKGNFYSIDQTVQAFPTTGTLQGVMIRLQIPGIGCVYEGKLSADGNTITGTIKQGFISSIPWTLKRVTNPDQAWNIPQPPAPPKPMDSADPSFEVATIKLTNPDTRNRGMGMQGQTFKAVNLSLQELMVFAYELHPKQILGAPSWFDSERYDITARPDAEGQPNPNQMRIMVRKLLGERFQVKAHKEKKELPVYAIGLSRGGAKISKNDTSGDMPNFIFRNAGSIIVTNATIQDFGRVMQNRVLDRPVVDQTGLAGRFDFSLTWTPATQQSPAPTIVSALGDKTELFPDLFTAMQQQLGLKLDTTKVNMDVLVIEKVEKASEN